jgi:hypothetical protein
VAAWIEGTGDEEAPDPHPFETVGILPGLYENTTYRRGSSQSASKAATAF